MLDQYSPSPASPAAVPAQAANTALPADPLLDGRRALARGEFPLARDLLLQAIERDPGGWQGYVALAELLAAIGHPDEAQRCVAQALTLDAAASGAVLGLIQAIRARGATRIALLIASEAARHANGDVAVLNELALCLSASEDADAAEEVWRAALRIAPGVAELHANLGESRQRRNDVLGAAAHYRSACALRPQWADAWNNLGLCLRALGESNAAVAAFEEALRAQPAHARAAYNLGNAHHEQGDKPAAQAAFARACEIAPHNAEAHYGLGTTASEPARAIAHLSRALALRADFPQATVELACNRLRLCDWTELDGLRQRVEELVATRENCGVAPYLFMQLSGDAALQQRCARDWARHRLGRIPGVGRTTRSSRDTLRVGYLSGDLRNHAVGNLIADLFAAHDRERFTVHVYSSGPDDGSEVRRRAQAGSDQFVDVRPFSDTQLAQRIAAESIDVLVDLSGYTEFSRSRVLTARAAPVQVSYLGFPGTMGCDAVDAIVVDGFLVPPTHANFYDERLVALDACYQASPRWPLPSPNLNRADHGLPEDGFVFCSFNNPYKIRPELFDVWMRLLRQVPGSVLWLPAFNALCCGNLRREATLRGVDANRLIFAPIVSFDAHSHRLPTADLFLDTYPYSAGATANQTLGCGVPLLTMAGDCYVSRMAASMLHTLGIDDLITDSLLAYETTAVALARAPDRLQALRAQLLDGERRARLFDPAIGARALEAAYVDMIGDGHAH